MIGQCTLYGTRPDAPTDRARPAPCFLRLGDQRRKRRTRGSSPPPSVQLSMARPVQLSMAVDTHAVFNTDGLARGLCNPLEPPASRAAGRRSRTRPRCARGGAAVTPPPLPARCGRAMPLGWGTWCRSQAASDPELPRRGGSRATARGLPPERGPVGGRGGGAHRQPLPGTREAWPQRVGWLMTANGS